jgi:polyhydroxyalkanoate synthesis regulator phasin
MKSVILATALLVPCSLLVADEKPKAAEEEASPASSFSNLLSSLKENVKDIDMSAIPKQIAEMKENYANQSQTVAELKTEVETLKKELAALRKEVAALKASSKN